MLCINQSFFKVRYRESSQIPVLLLFALNTLAKSHQSKYQKIMIKALGFGRIFLLRLSGFNCEKNPDSMQDRFWNSFHFAVRKWMKASKQMIKKQALAEITWSGQKCLRNYSGIAILPPVLTYFTVGHPTTKGVHWNWFRECIPCNH